MFNKKTWKNRSAEYPNRRLLQNVDTGTSTVVDVSRNEGIILEAGDSFSADNMNNLENRIATASAQNDYNLAPIINGTTTPIFMGSGDYFVFNGQFILTTQAINKGSAVEIGLNCTTTTVRELYQRVIRRINTDTTNLSNSITALSNSATAKHTALDNADKELSARITKNTTAIQETNTKVNSTPVWRQLSDESITFSNGKATVTKDVTSYGMSGGYYVSGCVNALGVDDGLSLAITNASDKRNYTFVIRDLTNPTYSGTMNVIITLFGYR